MAVSRVRRKEGSFSLEPLAAMHSANFGVSHKERTEANEWVSAGLIRLVRLEALGWSTRLHVEVLSFRAGKCVRPYYRRTSRNLKIHWYFVHTKKNQ